MHTFDGQPVFFEDAAIATKKRTREGFLVAEVRAARSGIYTYAGAEVGRPEMDMVRVYRPESTVFDKKTLASFTSLTITNDHPPEMVNSKNWAKYAAGNTGDEILRDGEYIRIPIIVKDQKAIDEVESGKVGLSYGYTCDLEFSPGEVNGEKYDAVQKSLTGNHLAIVHAGRAGPQCKIGDGEDQMPDNIRKILVDGFGFATVTDESERAILALADKIKKLEQSVQDSNTASLKLANDTGKEISSLKETISAKDAELGKKDAEIKLLKDKQDDTTHFEQAVADRMDVVSRAKKLGIDDAACKGKKNSEIVRLAVEKKMGDKAVKDKSDDYVRASFDMLSDSGGVNTDDPVAAHMRDSKPHYSTFTNDAADGREAAHKKMLDDLSNAWKDPAPISNGVRN